MFFFYNSAVHILTKSFVTLNTFVLMPRYKYITDFTDTRTALRLFLCFSFFLVFSYRFSFRFSFSVLGLLSLP